MYRCVAALSQLPVSQEQHHARHLFCGADRNITVQASITQAGILAGERIPFRAVITNHSDSYIKSSHVTLRHVRRLHIGNCHHSKILTLHYLKPNDFKTLT